MNTRFDDATKLTIKQDILDLGDGHEFGVPYIVEALNDEDRCGLLVDAKKYFPFTQDEIEIICKEMLDEGMLCNFGYEGIDGDLVDRTHNYLIELNNKHCIRAENGIISLEKDIIRYKDEEPLISGLILKKKDREEELVTLKQLSVNLIKNRDKEIERRKYEIEHKDDNHGLRFINLKSSANAYKILRKHILELRVDN